MPGFIKLSRTELKHYVIETSNRRCSCTGIIIVDESYMIAQSGKLRVPRGMVSLRQANVGNYMKKYSLPLIFTFYFNGDASELELFRVVIFQ